MTTLMNPERASVVLVLKKAGEALPYSEIAQRTTLLPEVALAHLNLLEEDGLVATHWGKPSILKEKKLERCFELTDKVAGAVEEIYKLVAPLRT